MRILLLVCVVFCGGSAATASASANDDDWALLKRAEVAGNRQLLTGIYLHRVNSSLKKFHLSRSGRASEFVEHRVSLEGAAHEVVRHSQRITCYAQDDTALNAAKITAMRLFPDVLSSHLDDVAQSYILKRLKQDKVAQRDCTLLELRPKDKQRYSVRLCLDRLTALPLTMTTLSPHGQVVEQYNFIELKLAAPKVRPQLRAQYKLSAPLVFQPLEAVSSQVVAPVSVTGLPTGFRLLRSVQRTLTGTDKAVQHLVFSDGLVMLSLFIEPLQRQLRPNQVSHLHGAISMATFTQPDQQLTLVGDIPELMLEAILKSVRVMYNK